MGAGALRALARLEATEPALNAFTAIDADGARRAARAAETTVMRGDALGPLHGVPVSVKDLINVAGLPARYGSMTMKDNVARADAPSVERLRRAGAIILGKTATPEFGFGFITNRDRVSKQFTRLEDIEYGLGFVFRNIDVDLPKHFDCEPVQCSRLESGALGFEKFSATLVQ